MKRKKVLITYASTSGSTQEIAEFIAGELKNQEIEVVISSCRSVKDLESYDAVVLGAPLYMFRLHSDAKQFLKRHSKNLSKVSVAIFAGGPYGENAATDAVEVRKNLDAELANFTWLRPASVLLVGGRFDPARLRFPYNLIPALKQSPASDARNWDEIRDWSHHLPDLLTQVN